MYFLWVSIFCLGMNTVLGIPGVRPGRKQKPLTPAEDAKAIDHGSVGVRAYYTVRVNEALAFLHHAS